MSRFVKVAAALLAGSFSLFAAVDQGLLDLVPADTKMLSGIQVEKSKSSSLGQFLMGQVQHENEGLQAFTEATGFDPRRDVQELLFASNGDPHQPQMVVIARGYFEPARVKNAAVNAGGSVEPWDGVDIILGNGEKQGGIAFLDSTLAVAGNRALLKNIIASRKSPTPLDAQLEKGLRRVSSEGDAWFVSVIPGSQFQPGDNLNIHGQQLDAAMVQSILQSSGWIRLGDTVKLNFEAVTRSDKDAQSLADVVRFVSSMVQMQRENQPEAAVLAQALDAMQLNTTGSTMHLSLSVPEKSLEQLFDSRPHPVKRASLR